MNSLGFKIGSTMVFLVIWYFLTEYFFMPAFAFNLSTGIYWNIVILSAILALIWSVDLDSISLEIELNPASGAFSGIAIFVFIGIIIIGQIFSTSGCLHSDSYRNLIGKIEETEFTANVQPIAINQMLIVDEEIAKRVGEKVLGADPGLGSRAELGEFTLQAVKGQLYWIAPLLHSGFWKWNTFGDQGTPGYVKVSATNQDDYSLVTNVDGKDLHVVYQPKAWFSQDLERHIYINGFRSILYGDYTFEVDDNWHPYWTVTVYQTRIGFGGDDAVGVLTVDPQTGEVKQYDIKNAPTWIDRIQPKQFVSKQVDDWGNYVHGYFNWSGSDKIRVAEESSLVLGSDGHAYFYFGLTSEGNDNSTVGFVMVDTRTKKAHWFKQSGATEKAARKSAEGKVQEKKYVGSDGVTYNVDGHPTYEFLLKDEGGLMKLVSLVSVHDHTIVGVGESRQEAIQDYRSQMTNRGNSVSLATSDMEQVTVTSKVLRIAPEIMKGNTFYRFILEKCPNTLFIAGTTVSEELPLTKEGDVVKVHYTLLNSNGSISIMNFDNLALLIQKDPVQVQNETRLDSLKEKSIQEKSTKVVDDKINNLTNEQKKRLLKLIK